MSITLPPIGAKVRFTRTWDDGTRTQAEGVVSGHPNPEQTQDFVLLGTPGKAAFLDNRDNATVTVEVLSLPEPADNTWIHVVAEGAVALGHVFRRNDEFRWANYRELADELRWWWYGNGSWETWEYINGLGRVEVLKAGAE